MKRSNPQGESASVALDRVLTFAKVLGSSVASRQGLEGVQLDLEGIMGADLSEPSQPGILPGDGTGERATEAPAFGQIGVVARPLDPSGGQHATAAALRAGDELVPIAGRDPRVAMRGAGPKKGTVALVGYGGAFHSIEPVDPADLSKGSIHVIYCPYEFDAQGNATKAHVVTIDPTAGNESIVVAHADGMAVVMHGGQLVLKGTGAAFISLDGDAVNISGNVKVVGGFQFGGPAGVFPVALVGAPPGTPISGGPSTSASGM